MRLVVGPPYRDGALDIAVSLTILEAAPMRSPGSVDRPTVARETHDSGGRCHSRARGRQHFLYLSPEPHQQSSLRPGGHSSGGPSMLSAYSRMTSRSPGSWVSPGPTESSSSSAA